MTCNMGHLKSCNYVTLQKPIISYRQELNYLQIQEVLDIFSTKIMKPSQKLLVLHNQKPSGGSLIKFKLCKTIQVQVVMKLKLEALRKTDLQLLQKLYNFTQSRFNPFLYSFIKTAILAVAYGKDPSFVRVPLFLNFCKIYSCYIYKILSTT